MASVTMKFEKSLEPIDLAEGGAAEKAFELIPHGAVAGSDRGLTPV